MEEATEGLCVCGGEVEGVGGGVVLERRLQKRDETWAGPGRVGSFV